VDDTTLPGVLRRVRRLVDMSQREMARASRVAPAAIGRAETGGDLRVSQLVRIIGVAGLRLVVLGDDGRELMPMSSGAVRDRGGRLFPAHLDTRYGDVDWWHGDERYNRERPWYTFDRKRYTRDHWRERSGTPEDHQLPQPGDSPAERRAQRKAEAERRWDEEIRRRREAGLLPARVEWSCACPPACDELDTGERPQHAADCPCGCDVD